MISDAADFGAKSGDAYLPVKALAAYSGLSVRTLRSYLSHAGYPLPCYRVGGKVLVRRSDYDSWVARFRSVAPSSIDALVSDAMRGL